MFFVWRERVSAKLSKSLLIFIVALAFALPWIFFVQQYFSGALGTWLYVFQVGNPKTVRVSQFCVLSDRANLSLSRSIRLRYPYSWIKKDTFYVPAEEASQYVAKRSALNETIVLLFASNSFSMSTVKFYLQIYDSNQRTLWQYPDTPVDAYNPLFNETALIECSEALHLKYLLLCEYDDLPYIRSELTYHKVFEILYNAGRFVLEAKFGDRPNQISPSYLCLITLKIVTRTLL